MNYAKNTSWYFNKENFISDEFISLSSPIYAAGFEITRL